MKEQTKFILQLPVSMKQLIDTWAKQQDRSAAAVIRRLIVEEQERKQLTKQDNE